MGKGRIAVIGGGMSGMSAAIAARKNGADVCLFDTNPSFGRKILKTGNGRCNFANANLSASQYVSSAPDVVKAVLSAYGLNEALDFFRECGIENKCENGLYYPYSMQAKSVRDCMVRELSILGVKAFSDLKVTGLKNDGKSFVLESAAGSMLFDAVILACGGMAAPESGSDGNGYVLAKAMGHSIITPLPALVPLVGDDTFLHAAAGVRADANVTISCDGKKYSEPGNLQITEYGISGICVMQLSLYASKWLSEGKKVSAQLDFLPDKKQNEAKSILDMRFKKNARAKSAASALEGLLPDKLGIAVLKKCGIKPDSPAANVEDNVFKSLLACVKGYELGITDTRGFGQAQVTAGGVDLKDIEKKTLASKLVPGLYFCGEILDVAGKCGGYNIQWAVSGGLLAGTECARGL